MVWSYNTLTYTIKDRIIRYSKYKYGVYYETKQSNS